MSLSRTSTDHHMAVRSQTPHSASCAAASGAHALTRLFPDPQWAMGGSPYKVSVGGEQCEFVADTELREQCIDGADLHTRAAAAGSPLPGIHLILANPDMERRRPETA